MRNAVTKTASIPAKDPIQLDFPYGESTPELTIRQDPKYGFDIFIAINGQFTCNGFTNETFSAKFDDGPVKNWSCTGADGGTNDVMFIVNDRKFLNEIKSAKQLTVEAEIYDAGRLQMTFSVAGLKWE